MEKNPDEARRQLELWNESDLKQFNVVMEEKIKNEITDDDLKHFVRIHKSELKCYLDQWDQRTKDFISVMYNDYIKHHSLDIKNNEDDMNIHDFRKKMGSLSYRFVEKWIPPMKQEDARMKVFEFVGHAINIALKVPSGQRSSNDSVWNTSRHRYMLKRPEIQNSIIKFGAFGLIRTGFCEDLKILLTQPK